MATLADIEKLTKAYADAREILAECVRELEGQINDAKAHFRNPIKIRLVKTIEAEAKLKAVIEANPAAFSRPRTQVFHGVKVGYQKLKGSIAWEDADQVVKLINRHFPDRADELTRTTVSPNKQTLVELPAQDLKRLGITVEETGDVIVIKPVDGEVEKVINALMKSSAEEEAA